jgi:hypothetical protein
MEGLVQSLVYIRELLNYNQFYGLVIIQIQKHYVIYVDQATLFFRYHPFLSQLGSPPSLSPRSRIRHHPYSLLTQDTEDHLGHFPPQRNVNFNLIFSWPEMVVQLIEKSTNYSMFEGLNLATGTGRITE